MAEELERLYTVPLRVVKRVPRKTRAERAVKAVRQFVARHMKADPEKVWLDNPVNEVLWARGREKPPTRVRVRAIKFDDGVVEVSLPEAASAAAPSKKAEPKKAEPKSSA
ncbi:MAG: 50S ribosomal protein L31e [Methanobacteriota archaeon]